MNSAKPRAGHRRAAPSAGSRRARSSSRASAASQNSSRKSRTEAKPCTRTAYRLRAPCARASTSPASSSTRRCRETAGRLTGKRPASSPTESGPPRSCRGCRGERDCRARRERARGNHSVTVAIRDAARASPYPLYRGPARAGAASRYSAPERPTRWVGRSAWAADRRALTVAVRGRAPGRAAGAPSGGAASDAGPGRPVACRVGRTHDERGGPHAAPPASVVEPAADGALGRGVGNVVGVALQQVAPYAREGLAGREALLGLVAERLPVVRARQVVLGSARPPPPRPTVHRKRLGVVACVAVLGAPREEQGQLEVASERIVRNSSEACQRQSHTETPCVSSPESSTAMVWPAPVPTSGPPPRS